MTSQPIGSMFAGYRIERLLDRGSDGDVRSLYDLLSSGNLSTTQDRR